MNEDPAERSAKYLETISTSLKSLKTRNTPVTFSSQKLDKILELASGYTRDAKHYLDQKKPVTSLACVAYAEGLLDALKFLELIDL